MNDLSRLIYLIGVVGNIGNAAVPLFVFLSVGITVALLFRVLAHADGVESFPKFSLKVPTIVWATLLAVIIFMPSQQTMTLIAASEMGETVLTNPQVQNTSTKAMELLNTYIDTELGKLKEAK